MTQSAVWIVVPTYNEAGGIGLTIRTLRQVLPSAEILVVDDNSPDGTGRIIQTIAATDSHLQLLHRSAKQGLGPAYSAGLLYALDHGAETIIHCDADGSHPAELLPLLLEKISMGATLAIASRYIHGGSMEIEPHRRVISSVGNAYLRLMLGREVSDWSSGCKAWQASLLRSVFSSPLTTTGYACLMEMSWRARQHGAVIAEVPFTFVPRRSGDSKFTWQIMIEDIQTAIRLRRQGLVKA